MRNTKFFIENYPRPQFVNEKWQLLNGTWDFSFDDKQEGEKKKWFDKFPSQTNILVPYSYQTKKSGIGDTSRHDYIWYHKKVAVNKELLGDRLILNFEGVDYVCKVWVNGKFVGQHEGGYTRFSFDITDFVKNNSFDLAVEAIDHKDATQPRGKQTWLEQPFGCWYHETNGIWKSVWLEKVSKIHLDSVKITPIFDSYKTEFEIKLNEFEEGYSLDIEMTYLDKLINSVSIQLQRKITNISLDMNNDFDGFRIHYWSVDHPNLYDVKYTLKKNGKVVQTIGSYFGFRQLRAFNNCLLLNNNPAYLKMVLYQGYTKDGGLTSTPEEMLKDLEMIKALGLNGVRMHQKLEDELFYYYADIMGLFVWCEMPSAYEFKDDTIENLVYQWNQAVRQYYNHPSIVAWVPINESWGVPRILLDDTNKHLAETLYHLTKSYDNYRPVISNDGWEHTTSDIVTFHNYSQSDEELYHFYGDLQKVLEGKYFVDYSQTRLPFAKGYKYNGQPVIISEFAGIGYQNGNNQGWGYGEKVSSNQKYVERLAGLVKSIRKIDGICGFCITQLTDVEIEINGLADEQRKLKASLEDLKRAINS